MCSSDLTSTRGSLVTPQQEHRQVNVGCNEPTNQKTEILVQGKNHWVTRKRETWVDLLKGESIPKGLK